LVAVTAVLPIGLSRARAVNLTRFACLSRRLPAVVSLTVIFAVPASPKAKDSYRLAKATTGKGVTPLT
jgi:molybdopterin biosynthesis enzyme MoaB